MFYNSYPNDKTYTIVLAIVAVVVFAVGASVKLKKTQEYFRESDKRLEHLKKIAKDDCQKRFHQNGPSE